MGGSSLVMMRRKCIIGVMVASCFVVFFFREIAEIPKKTENSIFLKFKREEVRGV
jgi:hypothetical protein